MKSKSNVLEYLAEAAKRRPGDTAVVDEFGSYTYKQLQDDSAAYGAALSEYDVANRGVVIMVEKCYDTLAIMLGTLFASGYYVPVDPSVPPVRLAHIVATLGSPLLVADEEALRGLQLEDACKIVSLEELHSQRAGIQQRDAVEPASLSIDPAYVLFTSGSTGVPKGVVVSHGAIISFIDEFVSEFEFDRSDRFANQAPFDFDVSVKDIFGSLAVGATLVIVPRRLFMQPKALVEFLDEQRVTVMVWAVAALCMVNTFRAITSDSLTTVRKVLFSGEIMPLAHLKSLLASLPDAEFVNLYGPTEITCNCLYHRVDRAKDGAAELPLGKAFGHCEVLAVDEEGRRIVEPGQKGEIIVRGPSLALGIYRQSRSDGKGVCAQSPQFPLRRARVPHGRQRDVDGRGRSGLLRSQRQSDQVPRTPNRAGRDRQGVRRVLRRRQVPMRLRFQKEPAMRVLRRNGLRERASRSGGIIAPRFHEADAHREGAEHAAEQEREGGPCDAPGIARRTGEAREG